MYLRKFKFRKEEEHNYKMYKTIFLFVLCWINQIMTMTKETLFMQYCFNLLNAWCVELGDGMRGNFHATSQSCED